MDTIFTRTRQGKEPATDAVAESGRIRGMGYVPGIARGVLKRGLPAVEGEVALIDQSQVLQDPGHPSGILVSEGAPFSHAMIGLLGRSIPTVLVQRDDLADLADGTHLCLDGRRGLVGIGAAADAVPAAASPLVRMPPHAMADGTPVVLRASVRSLAATRRARQLGASAIGLVRTEFLAEATNRPPDTDGFRQRFGALCEQASPLSVTFRLLDIAVDKHPAWWPSIPASSRALGLQGVRLYAHPMVRRVVQAQLVAIGELAERFPVRVLLPYLARYAELRHWTRWVRTGLPAGVPVGAMAETPAGVLEMADWFDFADFVAVGCNDLMQCLFAADRDLPELRAYLDPYAPFLFRFFRDLGLRVAHHRGELQLCGVWPQLPGVLPVLLGLGYRTFSVDSGLIPSLAEEVCACERIRVEALAAEVCSLRESHEVIKRLGLR